MPTKLYPVSLAEAWVTIEMLDELHSNLAVLYEGDSTEDISTNFQSKWEDLIDLWYINEVFSELITEAYLPLDSEEEPDIVFEEDDWIMDFEDDI